MWHMWRSQPHVHHANPKPCHSLAPFKDTCVIGVGGCGCVEEPQGPHPHGGLVHSSHKHGKHTLLALLGKAPSPLALGLLSWNEMWAKFVRAWLERWHATHMKLPGLHTQHNCQAPRPRHHHPLTWSLACNLSHLARVASHTFQRVMPSSLAW